MMIFNTAYGRSGGSVTSAPIMGTDFTWTGGDNTCMVLDDGGNWRIKFLSSGIFTPLKNMVIDVFLVGGGGPGGRSGDDSANSANYGGGAGGYTKTVRSIVLAANTEYPIVIGAGGDYSAISDGGTTSAFSASAAGGKPGEWRKGGDGGTGGGGTNTTTVSDGGGAGGSDGSNGDGGAVYAGQGQGTTTREFGDADGELYSGGGGCGCATGADGGLGGGGDGAARKTDTIDRAASPGEDGKGGGGGGRYKYIKTGARDGASGGSGIVVIRQHKEAAA